MDTQELDQLLSSLRVLGGEPADVEVKAAVGGLPKSAVEALSAFANTNGGLILLGVDEDGGFRPVELPDPAKLRDDLVAAASDQLTPPIRLTVDLVEVGGRVLVAAEIDPIPSDQRPCYVTSKGIAGSFVRVGDGDRRMSHAEIGLAIANRGQARSSMISTAGRSCERWNGFAPRATRSGTSMMRRLRVLVPDGDGNVVPSLAGLLVFGAFPQQFFPQLTISMVVLPVPVAGQPEDSPRFDDNPVIRGAIPELVSETLVALRRHLRVRGFVDAGGRREQLDYPIEAAREAVVNAVLHRDYSPVTRGTQIQIELHPDRLVVRSPGALFGPVTVEDLGAEGVSSSRNSFLAQLLSDTYLPRSDRLVAENRASGIPAMIRDLRASGLPRPRFTNLPSRFELEFSRSELLDPATREWIDGISQPGFTPVHEIALALMRHGLDATNASLREYGADRVQATDVLRDLVSRGLAQRHGGRRYARYALVPDRDEARRPGGLFDDEAAAATGVGPYDEVRTALKRFGRATAAQLEDATGRSRTAVLSALRSLEAEGLVRAEGAARSPRRSYRWTG